MASRRDVRDTVQSLCSSLEIRHMITNMVIYVITLFLIGLIASIQNSAINASKYAVTVCICLLPVLLFYLIRAVGIFRKPEHYIFCRTKLSQPHGAFFPRDYMYFTVLIELPSGVKIPADTHAIFLTRGLVGLLLEDYINKTVTVAYNEKTGMVVVIG